MWILSGVPKNIYIYGLSSLASAYYCICRKIILHKLQLELTVSTATKDKGRTCGDDKVKMRWRFGEDVRSPVELSVTAVTLNMRQQRSFWDTEGWTLQEKQQEELRRHHQDVRDQSERNMRLRFRLKTGVSSIRECLALCVKNRSQESMRNLWEVCWGNKGFEIRGWSYKWIWGFKNHLTDKKTFSILNICKMGVCNR